MLDLDRDRLAWPKRGVTSRLEPEQLRRRPTGRARAPRGSGECASRLRAGTRPGGQHGHRQGLRDLERRRAISVVRQRERPGTPGSSRDNRRRGGPRRRSASRRAPASARRGTPGSRRCRRPRLAQPVQHHAEQPQVVGGAGEGHEPVACAATAAIGMSRVPTTRSWYSSITGSQAGRPERQRTRRVSIPNSSIEAGDASSVLSSSRHWNTTKLWRGMAAASPARRCAANDANVCRGRPKISSLRVGDAALGADVRAGGSTRRSGCCRASPRPARRRRSPARRARRSSRCPPRGGSRSSPGSGGGCSWSGRSSRSSGVRCGPCSSAMWRAMSWSRGRMPKFASAMHTCPKPCAAIHSSSARTRSSGSSTTSPGQRPVAERAGERAAAVRLEERHREPRAVPGDERVERAVEVGGGRLRQVAHARGRAR